MPQETLTILNELKEKIVELLNDSADGRTAEAYQNCINLIDDLEAEFTTEHK